VKLDVNLDTKLEGNLEQVRAHFEQRAFDYDGLIPRLIPHYDEYLEEDIPSSVEEQTKWLTEAGFSEVGCHWRYLNFAIFGGMKS
jgi:hypothetical protein